MHLVPRNYSEPFIDMAPAAQSYAAPALATRAPGPLTRSRRLIGRALVRLGNAISVETASPALS